MRIRVRRVRAYVTAAALVLSAFLITDASGSGVTYTYDLPGRVTTALYDSGLCVAYSYDANGNRTAQTNGTPGAPAWGSGTWGCFSWTP
jgi:YD repeat-containing protein